MQSDVVNDGHQLAPPRVVISLDFELRWGVHDKLGLNKDAYRADLEHTRAHVISGLLDLFAARKLRTTWAAVGALGCQGWEDYFSRAPAPPNYANTAFAINPRYAEMDPEGILHFCPALLQRIYTTPGQELATHTFSHIYLQEAGITALDLDQDLAAVARLWQDRGWAAPASLVFPRNQVAFTPTLLAHAIRVWRDRERGWFYQPGWRQRARQICRVMGLLEAVNPLARRADCLQGHMTRSSLFLRVSLPEPAWRLHVCRIALELERLRPGEIFHVWWHPHNLGGAFQQRLGRVAQVLDLIARRRDQGQLVSCAMQDLVPAPGADGPPAADHKTAIGGGQNYPPG